MIEHKREENKPAGLDEELELYKFALGKADDVICLIAPDGGFKFVNDAACRKLGYSKEELSSMGVQDVDPLFQEEQWKRHWLELKKTGNLRFETFHKRKDGIIYPVEISANYFMYGHQEYNLAFARDITERKEAERELKSNEEKYRDLVEGTDDLITRVDKEGNILFVNHMAINIFGMSPEDCIGKSAFSFVHPEDRESTRKWFKEIITEKAESGTIENRQVSKNNTVSNILWTSNFHYDSEGNTTYVNGIGRDITERKKAEEALKHSEERFRSAFDNAGIGMALVGLDGRWLQVNTVLCDVVGYSEGEMLELTFQDITYPDDLDADLAHVRELIEGKSNSYQMEKRYIHKDGRLVWIQLNVSIMRDTAGMPLYFISQIQDVTERKRAEEVLEQRAYRIQQLLDAFPCFAMLLNADREVVALNKVARKIGATIGERCFDTITPFDRPCPWCKADVALESGKFQNDQTWGEGVYWDAYWIPLEKDLYLHFAFDHTEAKKAEEKIEHSLREKEVLLKEIHHRVKNNMGVIASLLHLQAAFVKDRDDYEMFMESRNRIRSMSLIHDRLYRSEDFINIDFKSYIGTLIEDLLQAYCIAPANIKYEIKVDDVELGIDDAIPCGLILNELVSNAIKHAFSGKENGEIGVELGSLEGERIMLAVRDDGIGLPGELDFKAPTTFGLQIVNTLAMQLKGEIRLSRDKGTAITLIFPKSSN